MTTSNLSNEEKNYLESPTSEEFPRLDTVSAAMLYYAVPSCKFRTDPEYIDIPFPSNLTSEEKQKMQLFLAQWNILWEAGQFRYSFFKNELPQKLSWLSKYSDKNLYLLPKFLENDYFRIAPLFHLLPLRLIKKFNLPLMHRGIWPSLFPLPMANLGKDFDSKTASAFAHHIWPLLNPRSKIDKFSQNDPLIIVSHNLNFWLPHIRAVLEGKALAFDRCKVEDKKQERKILQLSKSLPEGITADRPRFGGSLWFDEEGALDATKKMIELADNTGNFRAIIDEIKSNRIQDDFSSRWSYEKEDFERKLYRKRDKFKISFVELDEAIPIIGSTCEIEDNLVFDDFLSILNPKEKQITVLLLKGMSKAVDIAKELGYGNHSPVSKSLKKIRAKCKNYLELI